jgi:hypothetical protein
LQCADAYADHGSVDSLLAAISLVEALPTDHPLRTEIDQRVEQWAGQVLEIADQTFQEGDLDAAIEIARKIPQNTAAADEVEQRVSDWKALWEQAESLFQVAENHLRAFKFREAFSAAIELRSLDNTYWSETRYEELVDLITQTRQDVNVLAEAERQADGGTVEEVLAALKQIMDIPESSYAYEKAQAAITEVSRRLLTLAEAALERRDSAEALDILGKVPPAAALDEEIADFRTLIDAYELAWSGTTTGLESAIVRLQSLGSDRPLYAKAEALKDEWRQQLAGMAQLNWAKQLARSGSAENLANAIAEASKVTPDSPMWSEAQSQIEIWEREVARIRDQPILDRARVLALAGDRNALQAATAEAERIPGNSALYGEAQDLVADWRWRVQQIDNGPILTQARRLAEAGDLAQAIAVAEQIPPNEAFYDDAQTAISSWESTLSGQATRAQGQAAFQQALKLAQSGSVEGLVEAIGLVQGIPESSADWTLAQQSANQWSWDLLEAAEAAALQSPGQAVAIASRIPPRTEAYANAQLRIRDWQGETASEVLAPL